MGSQQKPPNQAVPWLLPISNKWVPKKLGSTGAWSNSHRCFGKWLMASPAAQTSLLTKPGHGQLFVWKFPSLATRWQKKTCLGNVMPTKGFCKCQKYLMNFSCILIRRPHQILSTCISRSFFLGTGISGLLFCLGLRYKFQQGTLSGWHQAARGRYGFM